MNRKGPENILFFVLIICNSLFYEQNNNAITEAARKIRRKAYQVLPVRYKATKSKGIANVASRSSNSIMVWCKEAITDHAVRDKSVQVRTTGRDKQRCAVMWPLWLKAVC